MKEQDWKKLPWMKGVEVLISGEDWVAVNKPAGVLSHPNGPKDADRAVLSLPWSDETEVFGAPDGDFPEIRLCHRLDGPTSGILLLALADQADWFIKAFEEGRIHKTYRAVVAGRPRSRTFVWKDRLVRGNEEGKLRVRVGGNGMRAETAGSEVGFRRDGIPLSLLKLEPGTGRTHQIRVQAAKHGLPIIGDRNYGDFGANRAFRRKHSTQRLFLHATELSWRREGRKIRVVSTPPEEFSELFPNT
ncbi:RluA family pseudouridine synthase [Puniceicoccus vermicola]|uniref:RNA pseudouridine synthase n=1 Tax=Puniceicoccus vermicola TaxID=388746 RepID=A0A7X1B410_9BACT|nr:RNA pseudouridine synthase [Puniceicoccus vermicola]MBC2604108.1 RNA pseudouridine synthase [Puniceicoccus vermicola]